MRAPKASSDRSDIINTMAEKRPRKQFVHSSCVMSVIDRHQVCWPTAASLEPREGLLPNHIFDGASPRGVARRVCGSTRAVVWCVASSAPTRHDGRGADAAQPNRRSRQRRRFFFFFRARKKVRLLLLLVVLLLLLPLILLLLLLLFLPSARKKAFSQGVPSRLCCVTRTHAGGRRRDDETTRRAAARGGG